ncbi:MAG: glycoside hydrolase family 15 protein, partial [Bacteroidales bacterium]|nr:glycoside hydrolase family 15 protein [Bacteroidales bacterium]
MISKNLNYGVVGNGHTAALISDKGSVDWLCMPDFDSPSVFAGILDSEKGGSLGFEVSKGYEIRQEYVEHTNILRTTFKNVTEGSFEVLDFMPLYKTDDKDKRYMPAELYRLIRLKGGRPHMKVKFDPRLNYGKDEVDYHKEEDHIKIYSVNNPLNTLYLYSSLEYDDIISGRDIELNADQCIMVSYNQKLIDVNLYRVGLECERTKVYWMNWSNRSKKYDLYNDYIERSMLVLKLLSYRTTGAILAAVTTSLPETPGGVRNWDYRYCWLRDASMSIENLLQVGHRSSARRFMSFIQTILHYKYDQLQIMYGLHGERNLTEKELGNLSGYMDSKPVRVGNEAYLQRQNDSFGYLMNMLYYYYSHFKVPLDEIEDIFEVVKNIARTVISGWRKEDSGIWEIRGKKAHFVSSKIMSWVALDRASKFSSMLGKDNYANRFSKEAEHIRENVFMYGWNDEADSFTQTYDNKELDASLLLMQFYGFIEADDYRYVKTVNAIYNKLYYKGLFFRYNHDDDFGKPSSAFTVCSFWMVKALFVTGRKEEARKLFEQILTYSNHLKLFSEDIDFDSKMLLGNFPQAYSHLALIDTALLFAKE